jgi:hypothetical protein
MAYISKVELAVLQSHLRAKEKEERDRKNKASIRLAIYHDEWREILGDELQSLFCPENWQRLKLTRNTAQNILKKVVNEVSSLYKREPARKLIGPDGNTIDDHPIMDAVTDWTRTLQVVNRYMNLLNDVGVVVRWDKDLERLVLDVLTPANTSVIQRDDFAGEAAAAYWEIDGKVDTPIQAEQKRFMYWDDEQHFIFDDKGTVYDPSPNGDNPDLVNSYGLRPFAFIHRTKRPGMFWDPDDGGDLIAATINAGVKRTLKDHLYLRQSFKQPWLRGQLGKGVTPAMVTDPATMLTCDVEGEFGVLDLQADFASVDGAISADVDATLGTYGLSLGQFAATEDQSGVSLEIRNRGLREIREAQVPLFRQFESELFDRMVAIWNVESPEKQVPEGAYLSVDFAEPEVYSDPGKRRDDAEWKLKRGLISPTQFYQLFNPDADDETAQKAIEDNMAALAALKDKGWSITDALAGITGV